MLRQKGSLAYIIEETVRTSSHLNSHNGSAYPGNPATRKPQVISNYSNTRHIHHNIVPPLLHVLATYLFPNSLSTPPSPHLTSSLQPSSQFHLLPHTIVFTHAPHISRTSSPGLKNLLHCVLGSKLYWNPWLGISQAPGYLFSNQVQPTSGFFLLEDGDGG